MVFLLAVHKNVEHQWVSPSFAKATAGQASCASETVGSNFFLKDRRLSASFIKGGFDGLAVETPYVPQSKGAASATSLRLSSSYWLDKWNDFRSANWLDILEFPETNLKYTIQFLAIGEP